MAEPFSTVALAEREAQAWQEQTRQRWESLRLELKTKLQLLHKTLEQEPKQPVQTPHMNTPHAKTPHTKAPHVKTPHIKTPHTLV